MTRARRIVVLVGSLSIVTLAVALFFFRLEIEAEWRIAQLASDDSAVRATAIERLGQIANLRVVPHLIDTALEHGDHREAVIEACEPLMTRAKREWQLAYLDMLVEAIPSSYSLRRENVHLDAFHRALQMLSAVPEFVASRWNDIPKVEWPECARAVLSIWEESSDSVHVAMEQLDAHSLVAFFENSEKRYGWQASSLASLADPVGPEVLDGAGRGLASRLAREHPVPAVRATALAFALPVSYDPAQYNHALLDAVLSNDSDLGVRRAALRLLAIVGAPGELRWIAAPVDFPKFENGELLADLIGMRHTWSFRGKADPPESARFRSVPAVDLGFGWRCSRVRKGAASIPWDRSELDGLDLLLHRDANPKNREAASSVLASQAHPSKTADENLVVHEWSLWREDWRRAVDGVGTLPAFVDVFRMSMKPVESSYFRSSLYVRSERPVSLDIRVAPTKGEFRSVFPKPSTHVSLTEEDAVQQTKPAWFTFVNGAFKPFGLATPPPRLAEDTTTGWRVLTGSASSSISHPRWLTWDCGYRPVRPPKTGRAWIGLRAGYPPELEPEPLAAEGTWQLRRQVGARDLSIGDATERFLHYDGAVDLPSPFKVSWTDASRTKLILRPRSLLQFPKPWSGGVVPLASDPLPGALVIQRTEDHELRGYLVGPFSRKRPGLEIDLTTLPIVGDDDVRAALVRLLGSDEHAAQVFVSAWRPQMLDPPGVRILTLLPQWVIDAALPLEVRPSPKELRRTGLMITIVNERLKIDQRPASQTLRTLPAEMKRVVNSQEP